MATRLRKLRINRVDCVDAGANQHARIALYKRAEPIAKDEGGGPRTVNQILVEREAREEWWDLQRALECSVQEIMEHATPEEQSALLTQTLAEFSAKALALIPQMQAGMAKRATEAVEDITKAGRVIAANRLARLKAAMAALSQIIREAEPEEDDDMAESDVAKRAEAAEAEATALKKQLAEVEAKLAKGDPEVLAKQLADMKKTADDALEVAKRNQDRLEEREFIEKAQQYKALPLKPEEDWRVLKAIDGLEPSVRDRALELLAAAEGQLALAGALDVVGKGGERRGGVSAWAEIEAMAKAAVVKGTATDVDAGITQVMRERPDLYERHRRESRDRT